MTASFLTIQEAAEAIESGSLTSLEATRLCLDRIAHLDGMIAAFNFVDAERAVRSAQALDGERKRSGPVGPLHGIPLAIKDVFDVAGMPTTASSQVLEDHPDEDSSVVARLRQAGAVILGKTNCDEFAFGAFSPPTANPWDVDRVPGGSSGGSAAAVASGMALGAMGTDTAGSIRIPASACGLAGLKPRNKVLPVDGVVALSPSLDSCGPIARTVADLVIMWSALSGEDAEPALDLKVGTVEEATLDDVDSSIWAAYADASASLRDAERIEVAVVDVPRFRDWERPRSLLLMAEMVEYQRRQEWYPDRAERYGADLLTNLQFADRIDGSDLNRELRVLDRFRSDFMQAASSVDVLFLPTMPTLVPNKNVLGEEPAMKRRVLSDLTRFSGPINVCPLASVTIPWALVGGLPVGMDVVAPDENRALSAALLLAAFSPGVGEPPPITGMLS